MASFRALSHGIASSLRATRSFQTSSSRYLAVADTTSPLPAKRPVGAFRGGLVGFATGSLLAGGGVYYYVMEEYRVSNTLLQEDIYSLQAAVQRTFTYLQNLEEKIDAQAKK